ncbi:MAG: DUF4867 family protein [Clostridia bacterium]|nr:DUF4867 family protein [Clostridia bacterium]
MLEKLKKLNPHIEFFSVKDMEFTPYGRVIDDISAEEFVPAAEALRMPENGACYELSHEPFENTWQKTKIQDEIFGEMPVQMGVCWGYNNALNGLEYHKSSEVNIAFTDLVLLLGKECDMINGKYDSKNIKAFYVKQGEAVEIYSGVLHFTPCQINQNGFAMLVVLPKGTNDLLDKAHTDKLLFKKNKWIICHENCDSLIQRGVTPGIFGENYTIKGDKL